MRIGPNIIDIENLEIEDMDTVIKELKKLRARKAEKQDFTNKMLDLVMDAREKDLVFISKCTGEVFNPYDWDLFDERA